MVSLPDLRPPTKESPSDESFVQSEGWIMTFAHRCLIASCCGVVLTGIVLVSQQASACSRVIYQSKDGNYVLVGRNMDRTEDLRSNLWVFPRGIKRDGLAAKNSLTWTAKYGSVGVSGYDVGTAAAANGTMCRRITGHSRGTDHDKTASDHPDAARPYLGARRRSGIRHARPRSPADEAEPRAHLHGQ